jgi:1-aminocyclopropane-1-carboxylate deaminase
MDVTNHFLDDLSVKPISIEKLCLAEFEEAGIDASVLRLDRLHSIVSGNKVFKLKHHLRRAIDNGCTLVATFGGAWSNHIVATASSCREAGLNSIGFIRGEEATALSATLLAAKQYGMELKFLSRTEYAERSLSTAAITDDTYIIPSGGGGEEGVRGSREILSGIPTESYSHIACSIGSGTMFTGLACSMRSDQQLLGIPAIKGFQALDSNYQELIKLHLNHPAIQYFNAYHFGGFARKNQLLLNFMNRVYKESHIPTDIVYTGKLFFACADLAKQKQLARGSKLLIIHSGGLQGNSSLAPGILDFNDT